LKLKYDEPPSNLSSNLNLRHYFTAVLAEAEMLVYGGAGRDHAFGEGGRVWRLNVDTWVWS
jgi:hypothetical protein